MRCAVLDIRTVSAAELARWETAAEPERRARWQQFRRPDDRARSICADHLARTLLREAGAQTPVIRVGRNGKPYVPDGPAFNCSHSGNFVCCAVHGGPVGIDLEARRPSAPRWLRASARRRSWFSPRRAAGSTRCASCSSGPRRKHGSNTPAKASASISARCPPQQQTACTKRCSAAASSRPSRRTMSSPSYTMQYKRKKQTTSQAGPRADDGVL